MPTEDGEAQNDEPGSVNIAGHPCLLSGIDQGFGVLVDGAAALPATRRLLGQQRRDRVAVVGDVSLRRRVDALGRQARQPRGTFEDRLRVPAQQVGRICNDDSQ